MATFSHISGAEPSTITFKARTIAITQNSSVMQQEIISLGDPDTSNAVAAILNTAPASTAWGLATRPVGYSTTVQVSSVGGIVQIQGNSTVVFAAGLISSAVPAGNSSGLTVRPVWSSTNTDQPVSAAQSGTWTVSQSNFSTTVQVSSVAGTVKVDQVSTTWAVQMTQYSTTMQVSSVGGIVTIQGNSTVSIGTNLQSTSAPSSGSSGLVVRQVIDNILTFASTSALASTTVEVQSSGANLRTYVTAYSITSTNQTPAHWGFFSSNGALLWPITLAALSSGVAGANLAVAPPGYLFRTNASDALNFKTNGSTVAGVQLGVSYFRAP